MKFLRANLIRTKTALTQQQIRGISVTQTVPLLLQALGSMQASGSIALTTTTPCTRRLV